MGLLFCASVRALGTDSTIVSATMADYISVSEALKLASPFKGGKKGGIGIYFQRRYSF